MESSNHPSMCLGVSSGVGVHCAPCPDATVTRSGSMPLLVYLFSLECCWFRVYFVYADIDNSTYRATVAQ